MKIANLINQPKNSWWEETVVSKTPIIIGIFSNLVVVIMDIRAYDIVYGLTGSWWKALSASLACAVPLLLWELAWQYNQTTNGWRVISLLMAGVAFATSVFLGVADFIGVSQNFADILLGSVVVLTGIHTIVGFLYYYNDPDVARRRVVSAAQARMELNKINAEVARQILSDGQNILGVIDELKKSYDPEDVDAVLNALTGSLPPKTRQKPVRANSLKPSWKDEDLEKNV